MQLIIEGKDLNEIRSEISKIFHELNAAPMAVVKFETPDEKPKKSKKVVAPHLDVTAVKEEKAKETQEKIEAIKQKVFGREAIHEALQEVNATKNLSVSLEILKSFGANRISEIKEEQFEAFIKACKEKVQGI